MSKVCFEVLREAKAKLKKQISEKPPLRGWEPRLRYEPYGSYLRGCKALIFRRSGTLPCTSTVQGLPDHPVTFLQGYQKKSAQTAQLEAELILSFVLKCERIKLHLEPKRALTKEEYGFFEKLLKQRLSGKPLQYVLGEAYFFGYKFKVNPHVLIPRPETEILVNEVISLLRTMKNPKIVDLGTGCGNIAIGVALNLKDAFIFATDISSNALKVAKLNAKLNRVEDRIRFLCGDLFEPIKTKVDVILSNPPYVSEKEFVELPDEIRNFEPKGALLAGEDGLKYIKKIIGRAPDFLNKGGVLALEIGFGQEKKVKELVFDSKFFKLIEIKKDLSGIPRVVLARKL